MTLRGPNDPLPPLRLALEAVPVEQEGKSLFVLRDLEDLTREGVGLSPGGMLVASLLDGRKTASQVGVLFAKTTGQILKAEEVLGLVDQLEKASLLETPEVSRLRERTLKEFKESPARKPAFAGLSYPADPLELRGQLGRFFRDPRGPGREAAPEGRGRPPLGLVSPHIDFARGGPAYAWAYQALSECEPPDAVVALGTAHMSPDSPWALTRKSYETPLGPVAVDPELYEEFASCLWYDALGDEWVHRSEHALEFQAVWLKYIWGDKAPPWVPVLCSSFDRFCPDKAPSEVPTVEGALAKLAASLKERSRRGRRIMVLAGVDLAHVGPRFGDDQEPGPELSKKVEDEDRASLESALSLAPDAFYLSVVRDGHWRKVCGLSALYTALRLVEPLAGAAKPRGRLLHYGQAPDPAGGLVSFAAADFPSAP